MPVTTTNPYLTSSSVRQQPKEWVRLALGSGVVVMGLIILATV